MWSHEEVLGVHRSDLDPQQLGDPVAFLGVHAVGVELADEFEAGGEEPLAQRRCIGRLGGGHVLAEVLEVLAEVEDVEVGLVVAGAEQVGAEPGPAPDHLPELGPGAHELEEHQVDALGDVDAGVEHVDRDGDMGGLVGHREVVDEALGVFHLVGDHPGEVAGVESRVIGDEPFVDEVGVALVLGEDDRLAQAVSAGDLDPVGHEVLERLVDRVGVEQTSRPRRGS